MSSDQSNKRFNDQLEKKIKSGSVGPSDLMISSHAKHGEIIKAESIIVNNKDISFTPKMTSISNPSDTSTTSDAQITPSTLKSSDIPVISVIPYIPNNFLTEIIFSEYSKSITSSPKLNQYGRLGEKIGRGSFAIVFKIISKDKPDLYADKISPLIETDEDHGKEISKSILKEISILRKLNHPNIIKIIDVINIDDDIHLILPLGIKNLSQVTNLSNDEKKYIIYQMIQSVAYLSSKDIVHRDIKLNNFVLFSDNIVKLIDFGISGYSNMLYHHIYINDRELPIYSYPPEVMLGEQYNLKADIWALGVSLFMVQSGKSPFDLPELCNLNKINPNGINSNSVDSNNKMLSNIISQLGDYP